MKHLAMPPSNERHLSHELLVRIIVPGDPVPKGRPRFTRNGHAYTPERTRLAERDLAWRAKVARGGGPLEAGPLAVTAHFHCRRKSDLDNLCKLLDALNGVVWEDDRQVIQLHASRFDRAPNPRTEITIYRIVEGP